MLAAPELEQGSTCPNGQGGDFARQGLYPSFIARSSVSTYIMVVVTTTVIVIVIIITKTILASMPPL